MEAQNNPKYLYHYTSIETFFKIITGKELWLFDSTTNYDKNESSLVREKLDKIFKNEYNFENYEEENLDDEDYSLSLTSEEDSFFHFHRYAGENTGVCICFDMEKIH